MTLTEQVITILVVVAGTVLTRLFAFMIYPEGKQPPRYITYLGSALPPAVIGLLVVYCLKDAAYSPLHCTPELAAIIFIIIVHRWKRSSLLSIASGTVFYMVIVQKILG